MNLLRTLTTLFVGLALISCEHKKLVILHNHSNSPNFRVEVDWSGLVDDSPTGMTLAFFSYELEEIETSSTNNINSHSEHLDAGKYSISVINQSPAELYSVDFVGMNYGSNPKIQAINTEMPAFIPAEYIETVKREPHVIGFDKTYDVTIPTFANDTIVVYMNPMQITYTTDIHIELIGYSQIKNAYGVISGIASGHDTAISQPLCDNANFAVSEWDLTVTDSSSNRAVLTASARNFGVAPQPDGSIPDIDLKIYLLLSNGKVLRYSFPVGECFLEPINYHYSIYILQPIELPTVSGGSSSSSGFDADVDDWGDEKHFDYNV